MTAQVFRVARHYNQPNPFEGLTMPSLEFYEYIKNMHNVLCEHFQRLTLSSNVALKLKKLLATINFTPPRDNFPIEYLLSLFVRIENIPFNKICQYGAFKIGTT